MRGTDACPVAAVSTETDEPIRNVEWTSGPDTVERFTVEEPAFAPDPEMEPVYADDEASVVEFERDWDGCVCELIEATGCPVESVEARDGTLAVTVHTRSRERLRAVIAAAREAGEVSLNYVVTGDSTATSDPVVVDRGRLTDRQREVLEAAHRAGYFAHPRETNAETIADELGVSPATFREHLATAQRKLLDAVVDAE